jgi:hypothetical protein
VTAPTQYARELAALFNDPSWLLLEGEEAVSEAAWERVREEWEGHGLSREQWDQVGESYDAEAEPLWEKSQDLVWRADYLLGLAATSLLKSGRFESASLLTLAFQLRMSWEEGTTFQDPVTGEVRPLLALTLVVDPDHLERFTPKVQEAITTTLRDLLSIRAVELTTLRIASTPWRTHV